MKIRYIGPVDYVAIERDKLYDVISIERGWYRIMTELDEDYLVPPEAFEIVEEDIDGKVPRLEHPPWATVVKH